MKDQIKQAIIAGDAVKVMVGGAPVTAANAGMAAERAKELAG